MLFTISQGLGRSAFYFCFVEGHTEMCTISVPPFNNAQFRGSFSGSFMGFVKFGDPNVHPVAEDITPSWATFDQSNTEMSFNRTEDSQPDIRPIITDPALLERCA